MSAVKEVDGMNPNFVFLLSLIFFLFPSSEIPLT